MQNQRKERFILGGSSTNEKGYCRHRNHSSHAKTENTDKQGTFLRSGANCTQNGDAEYLKPRETGTAFQVS